MGFVRNGDMVADCASKNISTSDCASLLLLPNSSGAHIMDEHTQVKRLNRNAIILNSVNPSVVLHYCELVNHHHFSSPWHLSGNHGEMKSEILNARGVEVKALGSGRGGYSTLDNGDSFR